MYDFCLYDIFCFYGLGRRYKEHKYPVHRKKDTTSIRCTETDYMNPLNIYDVTVIECIRGPPNLLYIMVGII